MINEVSYEFSHKQNNELVNSMKKNINFFIAKLFFKLKIFMHKIYAILEKILNMIPQSLLSIIVISTYDDYLKYFTLKNDDYIQKLKNNISKNLKDPSKVIDKTVIIQKLQSAIKACNNTFKLL